MTEITLENLGLTKDELANRLVDRIAENLLEELQFDPESGGEWISNSPFAKKLDKLVKDRLDRAVNDMAEKHVLPNVSEMVETMVLQETTKWGEKKGEPVTFREYLVQRAEAWIREPVDYDGKGKGESNSYGWSGRGTRIAYMIDKHLQFNIESAMTQALKTANESISGGINEAVRLALSRILKGIKVEVKTGR